MTTVTNTITDPGEQPVRDTTVRITLITGTNSPGYTSSGEVQGTYSLSADQTGSWSANLTPNSLITPANTYYQVVEGRAVSTISVPATGGPYLLGSILVTPPPTPGAPGITGVQVATGGTIAGTRPEVNLMAGSGVTVSAADNAGANRVDVTVSSTGGVSSVNSHTGTVVLSAADVAAIPTTAEGAANGVATLDGSGHLTAAQAANLLTAANIDNVGADIQPLGAQAAGATGKLADAGHVHPYEPYQFYVGAYGAKGDDTTDDTAAINSAFTAAGAYIAAHGYAEVIFDPKTYLVAGAPITGGATLGSAQIPLPVIAETSQKGVLIIRGTRDASALYHWHQTTPQRAGAVLRSTYNAGDTIPATGEASVIGGPTPHYKGDPPSTWNNLLVVVDGITVEIANFNMCGFDFRDCAEANVINASTLATSLVTGAPAVPPANWAFGLAMPVVNNNDNCNIGYYSCEGLVYGLVVYEHVQADSVRLVNCFDGLVIWSSSGLPHRNHINYASIEGCQQSIVLSGSFNKIDIDCCDIEWGGGHIINDAAVTPGVGRIGLCSNGATGASLSAALNSGPNAVNVAGGTLALEVLNLDQALGPVAAPAVPASGTALPNPFWRHAQVHISGGTVTQVAVDGVSQLSTSGAFDVPSGHTITLTYSAAPSWAWLLKA